MTSRTYLPTELPTGTSWIYQLNAADARAQCQILGIDPASTLTENRKFLSDFVGAGAAPLPSSQSTASDVMPEISTLPTQPPTIPPFREPQTGTPLSASTRTSQGPLGLEPNWEHLVRATAVAVGQQVATVMAESRAPGIAGGTRMSVLPDLIRGLPFASGSDLRKLVHLLVAVKKISNLHLFTDEDVVLAVLPRTADHLRDFWLQGISCRTGLLQLIEDVRDFFIPTQTRHSLISSMVYRAQEPTETLLDFAQNITDTSRLLIPTIADEDILSTVVNGLSAPTRATLAGLPAPVTLGDLLALAPRVQIIKSLQASTPASVPVRTPQSYQQPRPRQQQASSSFQYSRPPITSQRYNNRRFSSHSGQQLRQSSNFPPSMPEFPYTNQHDNRRYNPKPDQGNAQGGRR